MNSLYARAWYGKALALLSLKNQIESEKSFENALEAFEAILEVNPEDSVAWQYKGNIFLYLDHPEEALGAFDKSLELDPENVPTRYFKGFTLGYLNMPEQALQEFEGVLERDTEHSGALFYSGLVLNQLLRCAEALEAFTKAAELNPENLKAWYHRGTTLSTLGRNEEALEAYGRTLILESSHAGALEGEAKAYLALDRRKEALRSCEKALELGPASAAAWEIKGKILESMGKKEEALGAFERSLILESGNIRNRIEKGKLLGSLGRYREAFEAFESALQLDNSLMEAKIGKGKALLALGNYQDSLDYFRKVLESDFGSSESWSGIGSCLLGMGEYSEALKAYEKAISLETADSCIMSGLGEAYYKLGDYSKALKAFKKALVLDPENVFALNGKGNSFCKLERYSEALKDYEALLSLDYESMSARYNRGVVLSRLQCRKKGFDESLDNQSQTAFKKYLELSGKIPEEKIGYKGWKYRGLAFVKLGEYKEALKAFDNAIKIGFEDSSQLIYKGITLMYLERYEEALNTFQKAEKAICTTIEAEKPGTENNIKEKSWILDPAEKKSQMKILRTAKGFSLDALGRYEDALKAFESARKISENGKIACLGKGLVFTHLKEWEEAVKVFDGILTLDPENSQVSLLKAFALIKLEDFITARSVLENNEMDNDYDLPACLLGFTCSKLDDFKKALWAYRKATELNPKNFHARNGLAELYFKLGNSRGALRELEVSISEDPDNAYSRFLKGRIELEEQACEDALESFRRALALDPEDQKLLLWEAYSRYMYAEVSFDEGSARFKYMLLAAAEKLENAASCQRDNELKAYALYFLGLFYCKARYFRKSSEKLEECLEINASDEIKKSAFILLKKIHAGPLKPTWWEWWLDTKPYSLFKKTGFGVIFLLLLSLLLSHPAASPLPLFSWSSSFINQIFSLTGAEYISWTNYGREYATLILFLLAILVLPEFSAVRQEKRELELEPFSPPPLNFDIPATILEEFTDKLKKDLVSLEPMEESIQKLANF